MDSDTQFREIVDELAQTDAFGVDTEFHRERTYFPHLALVQISWNDEIALVDPLAVDLSVFAAALESKSTVVMHAATQDLEVLDLACGSLPKTLFDTQIAAGFVGQSLPSLANLVERFKGVRLPKGDRLTDWLIRPLAEDQRRYAASDVEHLLSLKDDLSEELLERGRLEWATSECEILRARGRNVRDPEAAWLRIKEARPLKGETAAIAQCVAAWRERRAAEIDQPVRFVMSDLAVVGVAQRKPHTIEALRKVRGIDERHLRANSGELILEAVRSGEGKVVSRPNSVSFELDRKLRPAVALVSAWVSQLCHELEIETSLVATRSDIEGLLAGDPRSRLSSGWRAELVGERVNDLVSGRAALAFGPDATLVLEPRSEDS